MSIPGTKEAIELLATIMQEQFQKQAGCDKLQFTPYGKCPKCSNTENCQRLEWILRSEEAT